ncbi:hypothetical protein E3U23_08445 [Erythrobacter litoralis]|uniref:hypothetical protein n=1 Tax=Erythrobacter litoralis TaxID=39960 RepID=UPI0024355487|nr:hypothetical protein [Erythrobacter litoralis]MDG6079221.1 hypothetical protein [Erythrobacter litoralis]
MADIPVEKKSSTSWIWWVLLILGILALLWWLFAANDDEAVDYAATETDTVAADTQTNPEGEVITTLAALSGGTALVGRQVRLDSVAVNEVVGDEGFTVGEGANETLVMFDEYPTPDTPTEGQVDVNPGSNVSIEGMVENYEGDVPTSVSQEVRDNSQIMIRASSVNVVN